MLLGGLTQAVVLLRTPSYKVPGPKLGVGWNPRSRVGLGTGFQLTWLHNPKGR